MKGIIIYILSFALQETFVKKLRYKRDWNRKKKCNLDVLVTFFFVWVFFHEHSQFTVLQGNRLSLVLLPTTSAHFTDIVISRTIAAESSFQHIASTWNRAGKLWFLSVGRQPLGYRPF